MIYNNPIEFPCPYDGELTNLDMCDECPRIDICDTYVTMLDETFDS